MESIDGVAYIGRNPGDKNVYVVTGDSGNGITHGILFACAVRAPAARSSGRVAGESRWFLQRFKFFR